MTAQNYEPLQVSSGFSADVIANGIGPAVSSTNGALDNASFCLLAANFQATAASVPPSYALPVSGLLTSPSVANLTFQLADYSANNSLRLADQNDSGILAFTNQVAATNLYFLVTSGSGSSTVNGTITFADNTTQAITAAVIPDWFYSTALPVVISGMGRIGRLDNIIENPANDPRLYQYTVAITAANQSKLVSSVQLTKSSVLEGVANIFAVSAKLSLLGVENYGLASFSVYPNPAKDVLTVSGDDVVVDFSVFNMLGQQIITGNGNGTTELTFSTEALPKGSYIVKINTDRGSASRTIIKI